MNEINIKDYCGKFEYVSFDDTIPEGDFVRFLVMFVNSILKTFNLKNEIFPSAKDNNKSYAMHKIASLVYYAYARGFTHASVIADLAENHTYFKFATNGITPDEDTINAFINKWGSFLSYALSYTVQFAKMAGFTCFVNVSTDGTFVKATNNKFNVIHKKDAEILFNYYRGFRDTNQQLKDLRFPAKCILNRESLTNLEKIDYLKDILRRFRETGANTIPLHDLEAIHIINKDGNPDVGYNIQTAVDQESKMFLAIMLSDKATDHYQFPEIITKAMENMGEMPETSCADAGYNTRRVLEWIEEIGLNVLLDNNHSAKLRNGHTNDNKYHKDNMGYDYDEDYFICFNKEKLTYQETKVKWDEKRQDFIIERIYYNKEACSNCKYCDECCSTKYRKVSISGGILALKMEIKMRDYENILKYITRFSTVEAPNGTLKIHYHINEFLSKGKINLQNSLNSCTFSYNLIRIYHQFMEMEHVNEENILGIVKNFCDSTNAIMPIWRNNTLPFAEEVILLPYVCESVVEKESMNVIDDSIDECQTTLLGIVS